jgi:hypothetical protein
MSTGDASAGWESPHHAILKIRMMSGLPASTYFVLAQCLQNRTHKYAASAAAISTISVLIMHTLYVLSTAAVQVCVPQAGCSLLLPAGIHTYVVTVKSLKVRRII